MTQFKDKSAKRGAAAGATRRAVHLPGPAGRRHPALPGRPGAGRRGPAPAPRAHPRPRPAVQPPLRRRPSRLPEPYILKATAKITDLQDADSEDEQEPRRRPGCIELLDDPPGDARRRSAPRSPTPGARSRFDAEDKPGVTNLLTIHTALTGPRASPSSRSSTPAAGYGDLKKDLAEVVVDFVTPFRERTAGAARRPGRARRGARRAAPSGPARSPRRTLADVYERVGFLAPAARAMNDDTFVPAAAAPLPERTVLGIVVPIPEPWAQLLVDWRSKVGDPQASLVPPHVTLLPPTEVAVADRAGDQRAPRRGRPLPPAVRDAPAGTGTFRPVSPVVFVAVARGHRQLRAARHRRPPRAAGARRWPSRTTRT